MTVETIDDFIAALQQLGWTLYRDETSAQCADIRVGNVVLSVVMGWKDYRKNEFIEDGRLVFSMGGMVSTDATSAAYTLLNYKNKNKRISETCIILQREAPVIKQLVVTEKDVCLMSDDLVNWAKSVDIDMGIANLFDQNENQSGAMPARHLAALAASGDVETLTRYRESFARGERAGFYARYITEDYIFRALDFAEKRKADPTWLPKWPRMRV
jgi:hypothetical protein